MARLSLHLTKGHIVGNHMSLLIFVCGDLIDPLGIIICCICIGHDTYNVFTLLTLLFFCLLTYSVSTVIECLEVALLV